MEINLFYLAPIGSVIALIFAFLFYKLVMKANEGNSKMIEIASAVRDGAYAYLKQQYKVVGIVFFVLVLLFSLLAVIGIQNRFVPFAFLTGGFFSGLCGFLGMKTATNASSRTAQGASESLNKGLKVAFRSGAVMGLVVVGFGLLDIAIWYFVLNYMYDHNVWNLAKEVFEKYTAAGAVFDPGQLADIIKTEEFRHTKLVEITTTMITFGMGASTQALFARVGGGIYTKAADVGADLVGKVEAGIPEDDPRNPATIADNVGDNVGDVAGMGADLYESYCGSILATAALGAALPLLGEANLNAVMAPMIVAGLGILFSIFGIFLVRTKEDASMKSLLAALNRGVWGSSLLLIVALAVMANFKIISWGVFGATIAGLIAGLVIGKSTEYYTSDDNKPTQGIAEQHVMGPATGILDGISTGMLSAGIPVITIVIGILVAFGVSGGFENISQGLYGISFASVGMLATLGITLATDAYGPIADNAGGNAEMSGLGKEVRTRTDALDMLGNTTAAIGKGFAIGSAALTAMALLSAYIEEIKIWIGKYAMENGGIYKVGPVTFHYNLTEGLKLDQFNVIASKAGIADFVRAYDISIMNPLVLCGLFLGAMMVLVFCAMTIKAVGRAAGAMVEEVRRQFKEKPGILEGKDKPDYARCVAISTKGAQTKMIVPSFMALIVPVAVGLILGVSGLMGLLAGALASGFAIACMLNNAGGAWDNAKKYIEKGHHGGKGSAAHKAGVIGDTVGDPFKDTAGPSLNILLKLMSMVSVVFSGVVVKYSMVIGKLLGFVK
ncbi:MAG: sodium-translocating pyrophosphatase [Spirochaetes bacterium RBG_16_49_21]|nr:MAG: sodium-translocating pyrophosphatase [Spirochaetes bacterium RBG_16_49_21]